MSRLIHGFPEAPSHIQTVTLGDRRYRVRFTYRRRLSSWYVDLFDRDGTPIAVGRRMSPGWAIASAADVPGAPDGYLYVRGADDYQRSDLGSALRLVFFSSDEIPDPMPSEEGVSVTVT